VSSPAGAFGVTFISSLEVVLIGALTFCEDSTSQSYLTDVNDEQTKKLIN
jgi:hypothetical protein